MEAGVADHVWSIDVKRFLIEMSERPAYQCALQTTMPKAPPPM